MSFDNKNLMRYFALRRKEKYPRSHKRYRGALKRYITTQQKYYRKLYRKMYHEIPKSFKDEFYKDCGRKAICATWDFYINYPREIIIPQSVIDEGLIENFDEFVEEQKKNGFNLKREIIIPQSDIDKGIIENFDEFVAEAKNKGIVITVANE